MDRCIWPRVVYETPVSRIYKVFLDICCDSFAKKCIPVTPFLAIGHISIAILRQCAFFNAIFCATFWTWRFDFFRHSIACKWIFFQKPLHSTLQGPRLQCRPPPYAAYSTASLWALWDHSTLHNLSRNMWHLWFFINIKNALDYLLNSQCKTNSIAVIASSVAQTLRFMAAFLKKMSLDEWVEKAIRRKRSWFEIRERKRIQE